MFGISYFSVSFTLSLSFSLYLSFSLNNCTAETMIPIDPVTMPLGGDVSVMKTWKSGAMDTNTNPGGQLVSIMN